MKKSIIKNEYIQICVYICTAILACLLFFFSMMWFYLLEKDVYSLSSEEFLMNELSNIAEMDLELIYNYLSFPDNNCLNLENEDTVINYLHETSIAAVEVYTWNANVQQDMLFWKYGNTDSSKYSVHFSKVFHEQGREKTTVNLGVDTEFPKNDTYFSLTRISRFMYRLRYWVYLIGAVLLSCVIWCISFMLRGYRANKISI